jgi:hypothetical protein
MNKLNFFDRYLSKFLRIYQFPWIFLVSSGKLSDIIYLINLFKRFVRKIYSRNEFIRGHEIYRNKCFSIEFFPIFIAVGLLLFSISSNKK